MHVYMYYTNMYKYCIMDVYMCNYACAAALANRKSSNYVQQKEM